MIDRSALHPAFLLHRRPFSDSSLLLECFTPSAGRFPAVAKGVRGGKGRRGGALLQPFVPLLIRWSGNGEVKTLGTFEAAVTPVPLSGTGLYCGFYLNELLMRLLQREDPHESLFALYAETLGLISCGRAVEPLLRSFEIELLDQLGYGLVLDRDVENECQLSPQRVYNYLVEKGPVPRRPQGPCSLKGSTLLALHGRQVLTDEELREVRTLTRHVLGYYLGDRPLKSRELFQTRVRQ